MLGSKDQLPEKRKGTSAPIKNPMVESHSKDVASRSIGVGPDTLNLWSEIEKFNLQPYIAELDVKGYTVVPPRIAGTEDLYPKLLEKILDICEKRNGSRPRIDEVAGTNSHGSLGTLLPYLLFEDEIFVDILMNPVTLAFVTYMLGENASLSSMQSQLKGAEGVDLVLHSDNVVISSPFPPHYQLCNVSINFTPYGKGDGPICFVPGSHKLYRHPAPGEAIDQRVAVEAEPGSFIIFTGNTWHGAFARENPGLRVSMLMQFARPHIRAFELYREDVTDAMLKRYPQRFTRLMGRHTNYGWREEGPVNLDCADNIGNHAYD